MNRELRVLVFAAAAIAAAFGIHRAVSRGPEPAPPLAKAPVLPRPETPPPALPERPRREPERPASPEALQEQTEKEGIAGVAAQERPRSQPFLGPRGGEPGTRAYAEAAIREIQAARHAVEQGQPKPVPIEGKTATLLSQEDPGHAGMGQPLEAGEPAKAGDGWSGLYSGGRDGNLAVSDDKAWAELWHRLSKEPLPRVDFTKLEVVGILLGARPTGGYAAQIVSAGPRGGALEVEFRETVPPPGQSPPEGETSPYALRVVSRSDLPVRYTKLP